MTPRVTRSLMLSILATLALGATAAQACDGNKSTKATAANAGASCAVKATATAASHCDAKAFATASTGSACATSCGVKAMSTTAKATPKKAAPAKATAKRATAPVKTAAAPARSADAGMRVQIDPETGVIGGMPVQVTGLDDLLAERNVVLTEQPLPGGGYTMDLQGTLQEFFVLQLDAKGGRHFGCAKDPRILFQRTPQPVAPAQPLE